MTTSASDNVNNKIPSIYEGLCELFNKDQIYWRVADKNEDRSLGRVVPYIDSRTVQTRLDKVVGFDKWKTNYTEIIVNNRLIGVRCSLAILTDNGWVEKEDAAHLDPGSPLEFAVKGAYSDAFKRAAVHWGIGRYLYAFKSQIVPLVEGKITSIPELPAEFVKEGDTSVSPTEIFVGALNDKSSDKDSQSPAASTTATDAETTPQASSDNIESSPATSDTVDGATLDAKGSKDSTPIAENAEASVANPVPTSVESDPVTAEFNKLKLAANPDNIEDTTALIKSVVPEDQLDTINSLVTKLNEADSVQAISHLETYVKSQNYAKRVSAKCIELSLYLIYAKKVSLKI